MKILLLLLISSFMTSIMANEFPLYKKVQKNHFSLSLGYSQLSDGQNVGYVSGIYKYGAFNNVGIVLGTESWNNYKTEANDHFVGSNFYGGLVFSLFGHLKQRQYIKTKTTKTRVLKDKSKCTVIKRTKVLRKYEQYSDLQFSVQIDNYSVYLVENRLLGLGASLYYERTFLDNKTFSVGCSFNYVNSHGVKMNLYHVFLTLGIFP